MKNIGRPATSSTAANEVLQEYSYPFTGVLSSIHLDIAGGDARLYDLQLKVVPNPNLNLKLVCEYPAYMERSPLTIDSVSGAVPVRVPIGSRVTIHGTADKPLEMARIDCPAAESSAAWHRAVSRRRIGRRAKRVHLYVRTVPRPRGQADQCRGERRGEKALPERQSGAQSRRTSIRSSSRSAIPTASRLATRFS